MGVCYDPRKTSAIHKQDFGCLVSTDKILDFASFRDLCLLTLLRLLNNNDKVNLVI